MMRRRQFLAGVPAAMAGAAAVRGAQEPQAPEVTNPRATSGDPVEPKWESAVTVTVGPQKADLVGSRPPRDPGRGGLRGAAGRRHGAHPAGDLPAAQRRLPAIARPAAGQRRRFGAHQGAFGQDEAGAQLGLVRPGDHARRRRRASRSATAWCCGRRTRNNGSFDTYKRTLIARSGNRFKLDKMLVENFWVKQGATRATLFALLDGMQHLRRGDREHHARRQPRATTRTSTATTWAASSCGRATASTCAT